MHATCSPPADLELLKADDVAGLLKVSPRGLRNLIQRGTFPKRGRLGRSVRWPAADVRAWLANQPR